MTSAITPEQMKIIQNGIRNKYQSVADSPEGRFRYPTGRAGMETLNYDRNLQSQLPGRVLESYCGVGNPFSLGAIRAGDRILDIGCGAGVDTLIAALLSAPDGQVVGVDIVPEMLGRARENLAATGIGNVSFQSTSGENLPFPDDSFDVIISNGVINLIPDKESAIREMRRVLKPGGRLQVADQVTIGEVSKSLEERLANWFQ
jgi:SAM-dependent methyltransferase